MLKMQNRFWGVLGFLSKINLRWEKKIPLQQEGISTALFDPYPPTPFLAHKCFFLFYLNNNYEVN